MPDYAFHSSSIKYIMLPNTIKSIGKQAFEACRTLEIMDGTDALYLPDGLLSIGEAAFSDCRRLKAIDVPASVLRIDSRAFASAGVGTSMRPTIRLRLDSSTFKCDIPGDSWFAGANAATVTVQMIRGFNNDMIEIAKAFGAYCTYINSTEYIIPQCIL